MMKRNLGKILTVVAIVLGLFVTILFIVLFNQYLRNPKILPQTEQISKEDTGNYYENGWDKRIISEIVEEIPIPKGFTFLQGTKDSGFLVQDEINGTKMIWIPYDENAHVEKIETYYQNTQYQEVDSSVLSSIEKYGGFYSIIEETSQYEQLKIVSQEEYDIASNRANAIYQEAESVNSHLISLFELQQVMAYGEKLEVNMKQMEKTKQERDTRKQPTNHSLKSQIQKLASSNMTFGVISVTVEEYSPISEEGSNEQNRFLNGYVNWKVNGKKSQVPIPKGFKSSIINIPDINIGVNKIPVVKIVDIHNPNLVYIWIPVNEIESIDHIENALSELKKIYQQLEQEMDHCGIDANTEYNQLLKSIQQYGGFYMAEAELGFDDSGNLYNKMRGMKENYANLGDYFRTVTKQNYENKKEKIANLDEIYQNYGLVFENGSYHLNYEIAKEIASNIYDDSSSVVSHLTYGSEWDTAMLWIIKTNQEVQNMLIKDSRTVPGCKYLKNDDLLSGTLEESNMKTVNGLYGLAGNLFDLTQETGTNSKFRMRGGAYSTVGNEMPVASRALSEDNEINISDDIGFRNCLYIKTSGENQQEEVQDPSKTTIIHVPIDSRPISRVNFEDLVDASGFHYIEIDQGLDHMTDASNYILGDSQKTRDSLREVLEQYNDTNTTVIINTSSYWFGGLIATRSYTTYADEKEKQKRIQDLADLVENNPNAKYYINLTIPRSKIEDRIERYDNINLDWEQKTEKGLEYFYNKAKGKESDEHLTSPSGAIQEWEYLYFYQLMYEAEYHTNVPEWAKEFYRYLYDDVGDTYRQVLEEQSQLHNKVYEYFEELVRIKNQYADVDMELIINIDDSELPDFLKDIVINSKEYDSSDFHWRRKDSNGSYSNLSGAYFVERKLENNYANEYLLKEGEDEISQLILARECVRKSGIQINYRIYGFDHDTGIMNQIKGDFDAYSLGEIIGYYMNFINGDCASSNAYEDVTLYVNSKSHCGEMSVDYATQCAATVKSSLDAGGVVGVIDLMQNNNIDLNYFHALADNGALGRVVYGGWNTISNGIGISMGQTAVYAILQQQANTNMGLSDDIIERTTAFSKVRIRNVIENGLYNPNRDKIYQEYTEQNGNLKELLEATYHGISGRDIIFKLQNATNEICGKTYSYPFEYEAECIWNRSSEIKIMFH